MNLYTKSKCRSRLIRSKVLHTSCKDRVTDRQERVPGFSQEAMSNCTISLIGAGGIGSTVGYALSRKGVGRMNIFDSDTVEASNLSRQLFYENDLGEPKGERLAVNLAKHSFTGSTFQGYPYSFQDAQVLGIDLSCDVAICGVDNGKTRVEVSSYYRSLNIPVIFIALDWKGESGYCFVQAPEEACFGCKFPNTMSEKKAPCRTPASVDIVLSTCAFATYAVDSLIMNRKRNWNYREVHLAGFMDDCSINIAKSDNCSLCGNPNG